MSLRTGNSLASLCWPSLSIVWLNRVIHKCSPLSQSDIKFSCARASLYKSSGYTILRAHFCILSIWSDKWSGRLAWNACKAYSHSKIEWEINRQYWHAQVVWANKYAEMLLQWYYLCDHSTLEANNHIAVHLLTNHNIDLDSAQCSTYSTNFWKAGALTQSKDLFTEVNNYYSCNGSLQMTSTWWKLNGQMDAW